MYFRALTGAAPLKLHPPRALLVPRPEFPRPHRRGPVEAGGGESGPYHALSDFRALTGAAPLKRKGRGEPGSNRSDFRALTGAAPLKLGREGHHRQSTCDFRALTGAAPLKPVYKDIHLPTN